MKQKKQKKVLFICSVGGHLTQMLQLKSLFDKYDYLLVTEKTDVTIELKEKYNLLFFRYCNAQNFFKYFMVNILNAFNAIYTFIKFRPDVIVSTGANTSVPMCYLGRLFGKKVIFIESFAKNKGKTLSGKLVYPIATTFVVQWKSMLDYYPKAVYWGGIY